MIIQKFKVWLIGLLAFLLALIPGVGLLGQKATAATNVPSYFFNTNVGLYPQKPSNWPYQNTGSAHGSAQTAYAPYLFVAGGTTDNGVTPTLAFFRYNEANNTWSQLANLPSQLQTTGKLLLAADVYGKYVWAFANNQLWKWTDNGGQGTWSQMALPDSNVRDTDYTVLAVAIGINGNNTYSLLFFGGGSGSLLSTWAYNTLTNSGWQAGPSLPFVNRGMAWMPAPGQPNQLFWQGADSTGDVYKLDQTSISKADSFGQPVSEGYMFGYANGISYVGGNINYQPQVGTILYLSKTNGYTTPINMGPYIKNTDGSYSPYLLYQSWGWMSAGWYGDTLFYVGDFLSANVSVIYADAQAPIINNVSISGNPSIITSQTVQLLVSATDNKKIQKFQVSNDGFQTVQEFTVNQASVNNFLINWNVTPGGGGKTISVRAVDMAGNISDGRSISVYYNYNTTAPTSSLLLNNGATQTQTSSIDVKVSAVSPQTPTNQLSMVVSMDGVNFYTVSGSSSNPTFSSVSNPSKYYANTFMPNFTIPLSGTLPGGDSTPGNKYVYVIVADQNENATILSQSINYNPPGNTQQPTTNQTQLTPTTTGSGPFSNGDVTSINGTPTLISTSNSIRLDVSNVTNATEYRISTDGGITTSGWQPVANGAINTGVTFQAEGIQTLYVQLSNSSTQSQWYSYPVLVDHTAPQVTLQTESGASATSAGAAINLFIDATDNVSGLPLYYSTNKGPYAPLPSDGIVPVTVSSGRNTFTVTVKDTAGNATTKTIHIDGL